MPTELRDASSRDCPACRRRDGQDRRPDRSDARLDRSDAVPTRIAPLADLIGRTRFVVLLAVLSVLLLSTVMFLIGSALALGGSWHAAVALSQGNAGGTELTVEVLEIVTVMMKAVVFYLIGIGLYSLFIAPLNLTAALGLTTLNDLELKVVSVVVVILAVTFLEHFIRWQEPVEIVLYGASLAPVVVALVLFQRHTHDSSRADTATDARTQVAAQRDLFHDDHEQRDVRTDEVAPRPAEAGRPNGAR
jgi:uncharacterized membrane protein YqhA